MLWALPRKLDKMVLIFVQCSFVENDGCFLGSSYYVLAAAEGSTYNYLICLLFQKQVFLQRINNSSNLVILLYYFLGSIKYGN